MNTTDDGDPTAWDPITAFTRGDPVRSRMLRANLERIREQSEGPVARLVDEVLRGQRSVRELVREPAFVAELDRGMEGFARHWESLTPEQRADLVRQGKAEEDAARAAAGLPPGPQLDLEPGAVPLLREDP